MKRRPAVPAARLGSEFFNRSTARVARDLLGARLTVSERGRAWSVRLVETEAYVRDDPANHAFRGRTARNRSMFGSPGTVYVYRIHQVVCANLVTRPGEAVLLRAGEPLTVGLTGTSGPGRLCRALGVTQADDGSDSVRGSRFVLEPGVGARGPVYVGPRVGIRRAADRPLRFALKSSASVSRPRPWLARATSAWPTRTSGDGGPIRTRTTRRRPSGGGRSDGRSVGR